MTVNVTNTVDSHGVYHSTAVVDIPSISVTRSSHTFEGLDEQVLSAVLDWASAYTQAKSVGQFIDPNTGAGGAELTIDITSTVTSVAASETAIITFTLSEPSTDFTLNDVTFDNGYLSNFSGSGSSYSALYTPFEGSTNSTSIQVDAGKFTDQYSNNNLPSNTLIIDVDTTGAS